MYKKLKFSTEKYKFKEAIEKLYNVDDLSTLHKDLAGYYDIPDDVAGLGRDTISALHNKFYDELGLGWLEMKEMYRSFVEDYILPLFPKEKSLIYQAFPSYRIHYPGNRAITTVHKDSDENHQHPYGEISFLMPLTDMYGSNAPWVESFPGMEDFNPMEGKYGDIFMWDGNRCLHYNKFNETGKTRISFDFRILPKKYYDSSYTAKAATTKKKFIIGEYYDCVAEGR